MRRLIKLAFFFHAVFQSVSDLMQPDRPKPIRSTLRELPLVSSLSNAKQNQYERYVLQLYHELPPQIKIKADKFYAKNQLSQYILLAAFLNKTAAINLIDRALEMGEDINAGSRKVVSLLGLISTHIHKEDYHQLNDNDCHDLMRYLLKKGAETVRTFGALMYAATLLNKPMNDLNDYSPLYRIFNSMEIILSHNADLLNRPIPFPIAFAHPIKAGPPELPLGTAIANHASFLIHFLLRQPSIKLDIKVDNTGFVGKLVQEWQQEKNKNKLPILQALLERGAPVYDRHPGSPVFEPMEIVIHTGQTKVIELLARHGAAVNYGDSRHRYGASPLIHSVYSPQKLEKKIKMMQVLLKLQADINELSPLVEKGSLNDKGIEANLTESFYTVFYSIIAKSMDEANRLTLIDFLLENNADPNLRCSDHAFPLHLAIRLGDDSSIKRLIQAGADPYFRDNKKLTAFEVADLKDSKFSHPKYRPLLEISYSFIFFLPAPLKVMLINICGISPWRFKFSSLSFILIAYMIQPPKIFILFSQTKTWMMQNPWSLLFPTALFWLYGIIMDFKTLYRYLSQPKEKGQSLIQEQKNIPRQKVRRRSFVPSNTSPKESLPKNTQKISLMEACRTANLPVVKNYLEEKTDLNQIENDFTPLQTACLYGRSSVVELLCDEKGLFANRENAQGETALFLAAKKHHWGVVNLLLDHKDKLQLEIKAGNAHSDLLLRLAVENISVFHLKKILAIYPKHHKGEFLLCFLLQSEKSSITEKSLNEFVSVYIKANKSELLAFSTTKRFTILMAASQLGYLHVVECLIAANANVHLIDSVGKSALYYAGEQALMPENKSRCKAFTNIIQLLLKQGAQLNFRYENSDPIPLSNVKIETLISKIQVENIKKSGPQVKLGPKLKTTSKQVRERRASVTEEKEKKVKKQVPIKNKKILDAKINNTQKQATFAKKEKVNHQSWANLIVDYIVRLGVVFYQEFDKTDSEFSSEEQAFQIYMQHCLRVYYLHRLLFALTCYGKHTQRDYKLIDSGQIHDMLTKRGKKSLCQFLSYETYDAVLTTTAEIVKILPEYLLSSLKKPHEYKTALLPQQCLDIAYLFGLIEEKENKSNKKLQPVGQLFIQNTKLYDILFQFHHSLTQTSGITEEHFISVKDFFLPAINYLYGFLAKEPDAKRETQQVLLKGTLDYNKIENHYRNYLDLLVLLFSLSGETLLAQHHPRKMKEFVKCCRKDVRNEVAHDAKITFGAEFLLQLAKDACPLVRKEINWEQVVEMPDRAILMREEMKAGLEKIGYYRFFESLSPNPIDITISYASLRR